MLNQINSKTRTFPSPGPRRETNSFYLTKIKKKNKKDFENLNSDRTDKDGCEIQPSAIECSNAHRFIYARRTIWWTLCRYIEQLQYRIVLLFGEFICIYLSDVGILFGSMAPLKHRPFHQSSTLFFPSGRKRRFSYQTTSSHCLFKCIVAWVTVFSRSDYFSSIHSDNTTEIYIYTCKQWPTSIHIIHI